MSKDVEKFMLNELDRIKGMTSDNQYGEYRISEDRLLLMPIHDFLNINRFLTKLSIAYPEYLWHVSEDPDQFFRGIIISWAPNRS